MRRPRQWPPGYRLCRARDVETLYWEAKRRLDRGAGANRGRPVRRGRASAPLLALGPPRAADELFQLLRRQGLQQGDPGSPALPADPPRQQGRALCLLPDRAQLLRADQRRAARPEDHRPGPDGAERDQPPLSQHRLRRRCAAQDRPRTRATTSPARKWKSAAITNVRANGSRRRSASRTWSTITRPPATRPKRSTA